MSSPAGTRTPVVVLASGTGSLLASILAVSVADTSSYDVVAVAVDRDCRAAEIAREQGIPVIVCALSEYADRAEWDRALTDRVSAHAPAWVVTAGFMKILGPAFLDAFAERVINSHPALLPAFPGAHGVADALDYGVKVTGCTVHLVDGGVDTGPILAQGVVEVLPDDTVESLHERIKITERDLLPSVVEAVVARGVVTDGRKAYIP
ncbi:MAG: phosphoribosylglycinamide formyltransferase [Gordonia sp. (in: high G+C Gram-positive bacteria)]|uniref:phosphoribosylglycinamide formyltransferase n=1 Tax=Gordonia sp. (in: high G+C Gram-positive bacteria) TaxID=84139 RepID=UPI0039E3B1D2